MKRKNYLSWNDCFMLMAHLMAERSKDPSTQAGAVIVDENNVIIGLGYNGFPRNCSDENFPWERQGDFLGTKYAYVVHAEENAVYNANKQVRGCRLYCTLFPCNECTKTIIQSGISEIYYESDKYHDEDVWKASRKMLDAAGIPYTQYIPAKKLSIEDYE